MKIIDIVKDKKVSFTHFCDGQLWYTTDDGFEFPVPTDHKEVGNATFNAEDKAIMYMRYIRKHIEKIAKETAAIEQARKDTLK